MFEDREFHDTISLAEYDGISDISREILCNLWRHLSSNNFDVWFIKIVHEYDRAEIRFVKDNWAVLYMISLSTMRSLYQSSKNDFCIHAGIDMLNYWEKSYANNQRITKVPN